MTPRASLCLLALALAAPAVRADPTYVIEQLVVSVTAQPMRRASASAGQERHKLEAFEREGRNHVKPSRQGRLDQKLLSHLGPAPADTPHGTNCRG